MTGTLVTARLELRPHQLTDVPFMLSLDADPELRRYTGDPPLTARVAAQIVVSNRQQLEREGLGRLLMVLRETGEAIGFCGLKRRDDGLVDLGYRLARAHWGKGLATEAAEACLDHGFGALGLDRVVATVAPENKASIAVLARLGFTLSGEHAEGGERWLDYVRWARSAAVRWRA